MATVGIKGLTLLLGLFIKGDDCKMILWNSLFCWLHL